MFYSQFILAKKGPLGTIWIAAHLERKLRKNQVADTDIGVSVDSILFPDVPIALRLSSHLLLGVVRIYSRKVNYLFDDCSEALLKVKQAFRSAAVDLPPEESKAPYHSITLPETFDLDDFELPDTELFQGNFVDHHVSSKEQITLQDTMDGVVFSTSQFGLDERFGDGDASQVGLDLDEELLLNKGTPSGHGVLLSSSVDPQASFEPSSTQKDDEHDEEMHRASQDHHHHHHHHHQASQDMDANCCIEAPSTPGLVEGPNFPITQEALVSDDHMEEDHNPMELGAEVKDGSAPIHAEYCAEQVAVQDNNCAHDNQMIEKPGTQIGSPSTAEPMELIDSSNNAHDLGSDKTVESSKGIDVEFVQNGTAEPMELIDFSNDAHDPVSNKTFESSKGMDVECVKNGTLGNSDLKSDDPGLNKTFEPSESIDVERVQNGTLGNNDLNDDLAVKCSGKDVEAQENSLNEAVIPICKPVLQPCNNRESAEVDNVLVTPILPSKEFGVGTEGMPGEENVSSVSVAKAKDLTNVNVTGDVLMDATPCNKIDEQPVTSENAPLRRENNSAASELSSPEKMLSLPDVPVNQSNELFVGSTPERQVQVQGDQDATIDGISGKKRSFAESTITLQSLNSVECTEAAQSKRTVDFVPEDDDLLSSILVGRRSTALKVKSTPPAFNLLSSKRQRVTPRSGSQKRKVLVDDSTVLHGDTIRQQLVSTEDIRRVRKKAPSTHPEIWLLQKHFLEEAMFNEPIFTGLSVEFVSLHRQPFDLSEIKLVDDDRSKAQSTAVEIVGSPIKSTMGEESELEGSSVPSVVRDEGALQSAECPSDTHIQASVKVSSDLFSVTLESERINASEVGHTPSKFDVSENSIEMETFSREPVGGEADNEKDILLVSGEADNEKETLPVGGEADNEKDTLPFGSEANNEKDTLPVGSEAVDEKDTLPVGDEADNEKYALAVEDTCALGLAFEEGVDKAADGNIVEHREEGNLLAGLEDVDSAALIAGAQPGSPLPINDESIHAEGRIPDEGIICEPVVTSMEELPETEPNYSNRGLVFDCPGEDMQTNSSNLAGGEFHLGNEYDVQNQFSESHFIMDATVTASNHLAGGNINDLDADTFEHDTDFLNFDDDDNEIAEDGNLPNPEGPQILDNTGWSTRTRAVANYLQVLFQKEAQHGRSDLHLDNLLANKSCKEASRMFFETLVLKTRDYIQVEQEDPFGNICVKPRARLLKPEF